MFHIDVDESAGQPMRTTEGCREAVGHRDVPDEICAACGGAVKVIAVIEDPAVIRTILYR